jgi:hypothetical protein
MSTPLPPAQHGAVLTGVKATPSGWPPASLDPGCGRRTPAATGSPAQGENPTNSGLYGFRGLPEVADTVYGVVVDRCCADPGEQLVDEDIYLGVVAGEASHRI